MITGRDSTGHAEINLVRLATGKFSPEALVRCTLYSSTEPCAMCAGAIHWSQIGRVVYALSEVDLYDMVTTTDSEASPVGMYVADPIAGTIEKALTPQVTLWDVSFSPERTRIAYRTFQWLPVEGSMPEMGPPFTLQVTDLTSGATRILQESDTSEYHYPVWSEDGNQIAYTVRSHKTRGEVGLFSIDLATDAILKWVPGSEGKQLRPWFWLSDDRLAYTEEEVSSGSSLLSTLYTIKNDGTDKYEIDSAASMIVIGVLDN